MAACAALLLLNAAPARALDDTTKTPWELSSGLRFYSRYYRYGLDLGGGAPALGWSTTLAHAAGAHAGAAIVSLLGPGTGFHHAETALGWTVSPSEHVDLDATWTHAFYAADTLNILSTFSNLLALSASYFGVVDAAFEIDHYFGASGATYLDLSIGRMIVADRLLILPTLDVSMMSQTIAAALLPKGKEKPEKGSAPPADQTFFGMSGVMFAVPVVYRIGGGVSCSCTPMVAWTTQADLAGTMASALVILGVRYVRAW